MTREEWVTEFANCLYIDLRPEMGLTFAHLAASQEWGQHKGIAPRVAAQRWHARGGQPEGDPEGSVTPASTWWARR